MSQTENVIACRNLTVSYDSTPILWDVNFSIPKGSLVALIGPNGAGKTTFLKTSLGFVKPASGCVEFFGKPYKKIRSKVCYVPQKDSVDWDFPITVLEVVLMGRYKHLGLFKWPSKADKEAALGALKTLEIQHLAHRQISELSGGQKQRVFLARALLQDAEIFLLDEPFVGIDISTEEIITKLFKLLRDQGKTFVIVHHDLQSVPEIFDRVVILKHSLIAEGTVEDVFTEENLSKAYGKRGALLADMIELVKEKQKGI